MSAAIALGGLLARKGEATPAAERTFALSNPDRYASLRLSIRPAEVPTAPRPVSPANPRPPRIGVTLRLDTARHQKLRHVAQTAGSSMQAILLEAFDGHVGTPVGTLGKRSG